MTTDPVGHLANGAERQYWAALAEGRFTLQRCGTCKRAHWPAVWRCSACGGWQHVWFEVEPAGTIYSWTRTWHGFGGVEHLDKPFVTLLVTLNTPSHPRFLGLLEGDETDVQIGSAVLGRVTSSMIGGVLVPQTMWRVAV